MKKASKQSAAKAKSNKKPTKAAPAQAETPQSATPAPVVTIRERRDIAPANLLPAPWNPRGEITPESVADLVASMATVGVIEPVVAMAGPDGASGNYILIAGHRRVAAAKLAGLATVPCEVMSGIDPALARRMTFLENLQRRDADPILEANLVAELVADGMTTDEIAAEIGRDRKWVLRRKNLAQLSPSWRKRVASGEKITTDCLEHIAAYPAAIQERLKKASAYNPADGTLHWSDIRRTFEFESRELKDACFDCSKCYNCAKNSGNTPDLFDWVGGKNPQLGRCLDAACFKRRMAKHVADTIEAAKASGVTIVKSNPTYSGKKISPTKTSKCNTLYTWEDYDKITHIIWSEPPRSIVQNAGSAGKAKLSAKEIAERKETRERNKAIRKLASICANNGRLANELRKLDLGPAAPFYISRAFAGLPTSWIFEGCKTDAQKMARSAIAGNLQAPPDHWYPIVAAAICEQMDPHRFGESNARLVVALFPEIAAELSIDETKLLISAADADKLINPPINWEGEPKEKPAQANEPDPDQEADDLVDAAIAEAEG